MLTAAPRLPQYVPPSYGGALVSASVGLPWWGKKRKAHANGTTTTYRVEFYGDSFIAGDAWGAIITELSRIVPQTGYHMFEGTASGGATLATSQWTKWITGGCYTVPEDGTVAYLSIANQPFRMSTFTYWVLHEAGAGTYVLEYQINGTGDWYEATTEQDADNDGDIEAVAVEGTLPSVGVYHTRIRCTSGSVKVIGAYGIDETVSGFILFAFGASGIGLNQFGYQVPDDILTPVLADSDADLRLWKGALYPEHINTYAANFLDRLATANGSADMVIISPHPADDPDVNAGYRLTVGVEQSLAFARRFPFFNCYDIFGDYDLTRTRFNSTDGLHLGSQAEEFWVRELFRTLIADGIETSSAGGIAYMEADHSVANTTYDDLPGLSFVADADGRYLIEAMVFANHTGSGGWKIRLNGGGVAALGIVEAEIKTDGQIGKLYDQHPQIATAGIQTQYSPGEYGGLLALRGIVNTPDGGLVTIQGAQYASHATPAYFRAGSWLKVTEL